MVFKKVGLHSELPSSIEMIILKSQLVYKDFTIVFSQLNS